MSIEKLLGKTIIKIEGLEKGSERVSFSTLEGPTYIMFHSQDCCESVDIEDIVGDVEDIQGSPIVMAEEVSNREWPENVPKEEYKPESFTWTFYKIGTNKGSVTIRWYGRSNGYYSERVYFEEEQQ